MIGRTMLAETQWAQIFVAAKKRGARWPDNADVLAFKREVEAAIDPLPRPSFGVVEAFDLAAFFTTMRQGKLLGPTLSDNEVQGCKAIIAACKGWPVAWTAYALATAYHETAGTMQPIREYGGPAYFRRMYDPQGSRPALARKHGNTTPGDGAKYYGRGYVQLTWKCNYERAQEELGVSFVSHPDLALEPAHAAAIMARGMSEGWFTGKSLKTYLPTTGKATHTQFKEARRIINGTDRAADVATYAVEFQRALTA